MLHAVADGLRLQQLRGIEQGAEVRRIQKSLLHVIHNLAVGTGVPLMLLHHIGKNIPVLRQGEGFTGFQRREGLKTKLRHIPEIESTVRRKRPVAMPYIPVMHISPVLVVGLVESAPGRRTGRPVKRIGIILPHQFRQDIFIHFDIIALLSCLIDPESALLYKHLHLIVAAPQAQGGMVADPLDIVDKFRPDILLKFLRQIVNRAGKHKILPHNQPKPVAGIPESLPGIMPAAPHADTVVVGVFGLKQQMISALRRHPGQDIVLRNVVCSHGKDFYPVHHMAELFAVFIFFGAHGHGPQADAALPGIQYHALLSAVRNQFCLHLI